MKQTQRDRILEILNQQEWVCGSVFLSSYLSEYRTRINELRKEGFTVDARRCRQHNHRLNEWHLVNKEKEKKEIWERLKKESWFDPDQYKPKEAAPLPKGLF